MTENPRVAAFVSDHPELFNREMREHLLSQLEATNNPPRPSARPTRRAPVAPRPTPAQATNATIAYMDRLNERRRAERLDPVQAVLADAPHSAARLNALADQMHKMAEVAETPEDLALLDTIAKEFNQEAGDAIATHRRRERVRHSMDPSGWGRL